MTGSRPRKAVAPEPLGPRQRGGRREDIVRLKSIGLIAAALALAVSSARADDVLVGVHLPLTGAMGRTGQAYAEGIQVAAKIFNESNKTQIRVSVVDDESEPAKAVAAVEKLAGDGAVAITGGFGTNLIGPASDASDKLGLAYVTAGGTSDELVKRGDKTFFRVNNGAGYIRGIEGLILDLGVKSLSIVYSTKEASLQLQKGLEEALPAKNVTVTSHAFDASIVDFKPIINKVKLQDRSEALLVIGYDNDYVEALRAAKTLRPDLKAVICAWSIATAKMAAQFPDLVQNVYGTAVLPYPVTFTTDEGRKLDAVYKETYQREIDYQAVMGYIAASTLFDAIGRAAEKGAPTRDAVIDELRKTDRASIVGRIRFNEAGDNPGFALGIAQHQGGKIVIVSPKERATGVAAFPGVPW